jgi:aryl-alcohol dehydrogenase-like predicted oxidoreductase
MEYREFGQTGIQVSAMGFGCWEIGGGYGAIEADQFARAVQLALDLGVNCFDTAEAYGFGASERELGRALGSRRGEAVIVTKFGIGYPDKPRMRDSSPEQITKSIEGSLRALGTDYVDVYLVHWPDVNTPFDASMRALEDLVKEGKVRHVGVSNFRREQIEESMETRRIEVVQCGLNLFDRRMEREILPYCADNGIGVMAYGPLAYGLLTGTFSEEMDFSEGDWRAGRGNMGVINLTRTLFGPRYFVRNVRAVENLKEIAARYDKSVAQLALRWVTSNPAVSVALAGCRNPQEVEENAAAFEWTLSADDLREIDAVFEKHGIETSPDTWVEDDDEA